MSFRIIKLWIFILFISVSGNAQDNFRILKNKESVTIPFQLVNNMIIIPVEVNGTELSFLVDTGVVKTLLFNLKPSDSIRLRNVEEIQLRGLGEGDPITALKSKKNLLRIDDIISIDKMLYVIVDNHFDLSAKMGVEINGIIGGDLFKDFVVKINYSAKRITFYDPKSYKYKKCNNCVSLPLDFYNKKPLIDVFVKNHNGEEFKVKLLIDSGGGDALWLFENSHPKIEIPNKFFEDYLGVGLNGSIYGKRSRIEKLIIGDYIFENALVSYPDSTSIVTAHRNKERNGTLGAEILKRFHVIFDYQNSKISLRKNNLYYSAPFLYNKSGIELAYNGEILVKERKSRFVNYELDEKKNPLVTEVMSNYQIVFKPSYLIISIRNDSPAKSAGLLPGDLLVAINGKPVYDKTMQEIIRTLSGKEDKKIKLVINRNGKQIKYEFELKNML